MIDPAFWEYQADLLYEVLLPEIDQAARAGAQNGVHALEAMDPSLVGVGLDWALINEDAIDWSLAHTADLAAQVTQTSMDAFLEKFPGWVESGDRLDALTEKLAPYYSGNRAAMVAITEVTNAFAHGNMMGWQRTGVVDGFDIMTAEDEIVCFICTEEAKGGPYDLTEYGHLPSFHVACRCYLKPVVKSEVDLPKPRDVPAFAEGDPVRPGPSTSWDATGKDKVSKEWFTGDLDGSPSSVGVAGREKDKIVSGLSKELGVDYDQMNNFIHQWAATSNDTDYASLQIQKVASELFGTDLSDWQKGKWAEVLENRESYLKEYGKLFANTKSVFEDENGNYIGPAKYGSPEGLVRAALESMYRTTQDRLGAGGIEEIVLYRGLGFASDPGLIIGDITKFSSNVIESWTLNPGTAGQFAASSDDAFRIVFEARIPANRVIGTARTGFGCLDEWEYVILGGGRYNLDDLAKVVYTAVADF